MDMSEVTAFEVGVIKLSQAIRIGAKLRPQCVGGMFVDGGSCAIGAAYEGLTGKTGAGTRREYLVVVNHYGQAVLDMVWRMNDLEEMTREDIAHHLEARGL